MDSNNTPRDDESHLTETPEPEKASEVEQPRYTADGALDEEGRPLHEWLGWTRAPGFSGPRQQHY